MLCRNQVVPFIAMIACQLVWTNFTHAATIDDIESATGGTYLDFEFDLGGGAGSGTDGVFTRGGLTATGTGTDWGFPDVSVGGPGGDGVNATGMDSAPPNADPEFRIDVTGLTASSYNLHVIGIGHTDIAQDWGFQWGLTSGSLNNIEDSATAPGTLLIVDSGGTVNTYGVPVGLVSPAGGSLTLFFDNNTGDAGPRTAIDGIVLTAVAEAAVPEPSTISLVILGLISLVSLKRRRRTSR